MAADPLPLNAGQRVILTRVSHDGLHDTFTVLSATLFHPTGLAAAGVQSYYFTSLPACMISENVPLRNSIYEMFFNF